MRKLVLIICALALAAPPAASAHQLHDVRHGQAEALSNMLVNWRVQRGLFPTFPNISTLAASIAIEQANWQERRFSRRIGGQPFSEWTVPFFGPDVRGIIAQVRCGLGDEGGSWRPANVYSGIRHSAKARAILGLPFWSWMSVRSAKMHSHEGWLAGRGICQMYYVLFAAPVAAADAGTTYEAGR